MKIVESDGNGRWDKYKENVVGGFIGVIRRVYGEVWKTYLSD